MKSVVLIVIAVGSALAIGCGSGSSAQTISPPPNHQQRGTAVALAPEVAITKLETSEERVEYLHQLGKDSAFEPQKHADMLQKYSSDADQEVASAAKELLDRSK
ncbi:MAG TPA: hypothetical protein VMR25_25990 [Planctomycetaceae bacterium]|nr:hypothetical protein [Planctomycetaceae bacterium]